MFAGGKKASMTQEMDSRLEQGFPTKANFEFWHIAIMNCTFKQTQRFQNKGIFENFSIAKAS